MGPLGYADVRHLWGTENGRGCLLSIIQGIAFQDVRECRQGYCIVGTVKAKPRAARFLMRHVCNTLVLGFREDTHC